MSARRRWGRPLVPLYAAALRLQDSLRRAGLLRTRTLEWPVISVGSLSAGGAGKTPVVIALARLLRDAGWRVDVLSRGYGRAGGGVARVHAGFTDSARRYGDEPVLIAEQTGVPVWVGADRYAAGKRAEEEAEAEADDRPGSVHPPRSVHLLDDGFQHRRLARSIDIVLVTAEDLDDRLLPEGDLRESLSALQRADVVVVRQNEVEAHPDVEVDAEINVEGNAEIDAEVDAEIEAEIEAELDVEADAELDAEVEAEIDAELDVEADAELDAGNAWQAIPVNQRVWAMLREHGQMWTVRRSLVFPAPLLVFGAGLRPIAFCGIARPEGFAWMLHEAGCGVIEVVAFADHHRYNKADMERLIEVARSVRGSGFVTTEKDAVKLTGPLREQLEAYGPLMVVALEAKFADGSAVLRALEAKLEAKLAAKLAAELDANQPGSAARPS